MLRLVGQAYAVGATNASLGRQFRLYSFGINDDALLPVVFIATS